MVLNKMDKEFDEEFFFADVSSVKMFRGAVDFRLKQQGLIK